ncbi:bacterioferritin-associated ferredoxin [Teredinibacter turnerae]|uniref:Bacterioferritin-associated ferredoxin n=1 Tax=Teredinibacter turnerae (strain ATCC 39867 / T7901) TaxID=377629 RepID=C5BPM6_TERTT|nr:bacterioferritin-associated ferredoxin [Teredinibacter turnerae]ACR11482.1 putative bacterioferritin-associated ferredoxin BFD-like-binding region [Teredinibacter turnerae T7901]
MYVCLCKGVTDSAIRDAVDAGAESLRQVRDQLGVASQCGKCACVAREVINEHMESARSDTAGAIFYDVA